MSKPECLGGMVFLLSQMLALSPLALEDASAMLKTPLAHWTHDLSPFLIRFPENPLGLEGIRYYGLSYLVAFVLAWVFFSFARSKGRSPLNSEAATSLLTYLVIGVIVGGRVGYVLLYDTTAWLGDPLLIFKVWEGGMASHGGFVGVGLAMYFFARSQKLRPLEVSDLVTVVAPLGLFFGRLANFINGELWGRVTDVSWGVIFPKATPFYDSASGLLVNLPRHPSQLYQAGLEGLLLFAYLQFRFWKHRPTTGKLTAEFLIGYGLLRIIGEVFREPDAPLILEISRGMFYSLFVVLVGVCLRRYVLQREKYVQD